MANKKHNEKGIKIILTYIAKCLPYLAAIVGIISWITVTIERHHTLATLTPNMIKFVRGNNILYYGNIKNDSAAHAEDVTFKAQYKNGIVRRFYVDPNVDLIDEKAINYKNPKYIAHFFLKRLSYNSYCDITIIVDGAKANVQENIDLSWKNRGHNTIVPQQATEESQREYENKYKSSEEVNDESFCARKRWFERNNKGINK